MRRRRARRPPREEVEPDPDGRPRGHANTAAHEAPPHGDGDDVLVLDGDAFSEGRAPRRAAPAAPAERQQEQKRRDDDDGDVQREGRRENGDAVAPVEDAISDLGADEDEGLARHEHVETGLEPPGRPRREENGRASLAREEPAVEAQRPEEDGRQDLLVDGVVRALADGAVEREVEPPKARAEETNGATRRVHGQRPPPVRLLAPRVRLCRAASVEAGLYGADDAEHGEQCRKEAHDEHDDAQPSDVPRLVALPEAQRVAHVLGCLTRAYRAVLFMLKLVTCATST